MGFTDNLNSVHNPAQIYLRWKGGAEKVREDGKEKIEGGKLIFWNKDDQVEEEVDLPIVVCPLEITYSYNGFIPDKGRLWSNEILDFNTTPIAIHRTGEDDEIIIKGLYEEIKDKAFAAGAKLQTNVYCYCKELGGIIRLNLGGSAKSAWKDFNKKSGYGKIFECPVRISVGEPQESKLGTFIPPKYELGKPYDNDAIEQLKKLDSEVIDYLKYLANRKSNAEVGDVVPQDIPDNIDEIIPGATDASDEINLSDIPF